MAELRVLPEPWVRGSRGAADRGTTACRHGLDGVVLREVSLLRILHVVVNHDAQLVTRLAGNGAQTA